MARVKVLKGESGLPIKGEDRARYYYKTSNADVPSWYAWKPAKSGMLAQAGYLEAMAEEDFWAYCQEARRTNRLLYEAQRRYLASLVWVNGGWELPEPVRLAA